MRISSIDIGSNAIRLVIVEVQPTGQWLQIKKFRVPLRLGTDVFEKGQLQDSTLNELVLSFKKIKQLHNKYRVKKVSALATSAMRDAKNGAQAIQLIYKTSQIKIKIISGTEEARLIRQAITHSRSVHCQKALLLDIGGGSAEFTSLIQQKVTFSKSFPLGVVRLLKLSQTPQFNLKKHCMKYLQTLKNPQLTFDSLVGTGGNFDALAKLKLSLLKKAPQTHLTQNELKQIYSQFKKLTDQQKLQLGLRPDRIDVLPLAIELILLSLEHFNIQNIKIPMTGLKEGIIYDLI